MVCFSVSGGGYRRSIDLSWDWQRIPHQQRDSKYATKWWWGVTTLNYNALYLKMRFTHLIDILYLMINYTIIDHRILIDMDIMCAQCSSLTLCKSLSVAIFLMPTNVSDEWTKFFWWNRKTVNGSHGCYVLVKMHMLKWWVRDGALDELILAVSWHAIAIQTRYVLCVDFVNKHFICCLQVKQGMEQNVSNATSLHTMWCYYQTHSLFFITGTLE